MIEKHKFPACGMILLHTCDLEVGITDELLHFRERKKSDVRIIQDAFVDIHPRIAENQIDEYRIMPDIRNAGKHVSPLFEMPRYFFQRIPGIVQVFQDIGAYNAVKLGIVKRKISLLYIKRENIVDILLRSQGHSFLIDINAG